MASTSIVNSVLRLPSLISCARAKNSMSLPSEFALIVAEALVAAHQCLLLM
jgi:hypothetical protein